MLKLMKYEFRKTWITKVILLGITAALEALFLFGLYADKEDPLYLSILLLTFLAIGGILVIGLESVLTLHRDMNTRQSYMLFMTPHSSYAILGAKVLECGLSILVTGAFFFALGALDITLLFAKNGELSRLWEMIQDFLSHFTLSNGAPLPTLDTLTLGLVTFQLLTGWIETVTAAYLAVVVSAALLNGKKFNGLLSFLLFLVLGWFVSWVEGKATSPIRDSNTLMLVYSLLSLGFSAVMYFITAQIMERKLSV